MALPFFQSPARKLRDQMVAVDLGSRTTKAVHMQRRGDTFALCGYALLDAPIFEKTLSAELLAEHLKAQKPHGGNVCLVLGNVAADNINQRAAGTRDTLAGRKGAERLNGENGWKEISGCPLFTNDDAAKGNQMMADVLTANKNLDAFVLEGGWPQFAPQAYAQLTSQYMDRIKSKQLVLVVADTLPPRIEALKAGRSDAQVGQRPFEMGYKAIYFLKDIKDGKAPPKDPTYTGLDVCTPKTADTCVGAGS